MLAGPTAGERDRSLTSWFSSATARVLRSASVADGTARIDIDDRRDVIPNASSSRTTMLLAQQDHAATRFYGVERTRRSLET